MVRAWQPLEASVLRYGNRYKMRAVRSKGVFGAKKGVFSAVRKKVKMSNRTTGRPLATGSGKTAVKASFTPHWQGDKAK